MCATSPRPWPPNGKTSRAARPRCATPKRPILRLLADDLTGALDTAARFVPLVGPVAAIWRGEPPAGSVAIDAATREGPEAEAIATVSRLAPALLGADFAFKKIDSLLRGHVAAELAVCLPCFDHVVLAPAFPFQGRVTRGGLQYARDGEAWRAVGPAHLPIAMRDAETDNDLRRIVAEGRRLAGRVLWVGTAGLAGALAEGAPGGVPGGAPVPRPALPGPLLMLIGSDHPVSRAQVAAARAAGVVVRTVDVPEATPRPEAKRLIARRFAQVLAETPRPGTLFVSGGETLRDVCDSLGARFLVVDGEFEPGVPCSLLSGGVWDGLRVVSKSGAFGDEAFGARIARQGIRT